MFKPLKKEEVEKTHHMSLDVLEKTGIEVESDIALAIFKERGARIVSERNRSVVHLPSLMVEEALENAPRSWVIYGRKEGSVIRNERGNMPLFGPSGAPHMIYDPETGENRKAGLKDFLRFIEL